MASDLKIAYGNSRFAKRWGNKRISFEALAYFLTGILYFYCCFSH